MTVTINTVDGKTIRKEINKIEYEDILESLQDDSFLSIEVGDIRHIIGTAHIVSVITSK